MLSTNEWKPILAGNIGNPFSKSVLDLLNGDLEGNIFVLEISSFQLEFIDQFHPFISIYLNISADHLDRHKNMDEYLKMKLNMVKNVDENDFIIYNSDDKILNTSFNENEPIVCEPSQALDCFLRTKMDYLVMQNYLLGRENF